MRLIRWLVIVTVPLVLVMGAVRVFTLPWYVTLEYSKPSFPDDPLGMLYEERVSLAQACIRFLNRPHDTELLAKLRFQDGSIVFNQRELSHMDDVKLVYDRMTAMVGFIFILTTALAIIKVRRDGLHEILQSLSLGGAITVLILVFIGLWMLVGFNAFFTAFHGIFFKEGTWLFYTTDSLIRLFPLRFWQDAGIGIAVVVTVCALLVIVTGWWLTRYIPRHSKSSTP